MQAPQFVPFHQHAQPPPHFHHLPLVTRHRHRQVYRVRNHEVPRLAAAPLRADPHLVRHNQLLFDPLHRALALPQNLLQRGNQNRIAPPLMPPDHPRHHPLCRRRRHLRSPKRIRGGASFSLRIKQRPRAARGHHPRILRAHPPHTFTQKMPTTARHNKKSNTSSPIADPTLIENVSILRPPRTRVRCSIISPRPPANAPARCRTSPRSPPSSRDRVAPRPAASSTSPCPTPAPSPVHTPAAPSSPPAKSPPTSTSGSTASAPPDCPAAPLPRSPIAGSSARPPRCPSHARSNRPLAPPPGRPAAPTHRPAAPRISAPRPPPPDPAPPSVPRFRRSPSAAPPSPPCSPQSSPTPCPPS